VYWFFITILNLKDIRIVWKSLSSISDCLDGAGFIDLHLSAEGFRHFTPRWL